METEKLIIPVKSRTSFKKSDTKKLRRDNLVPAIVYGPGQKNQAVSLDVRVAEKFSKTTYENKIFTFQSDDKNLNGLKVIRKDMTVHLLSRKPLHLDFFSLDMTHSIRVNVEIRFEGKPKGVREEGGVFSATLRSVEVECLPANIPAFLTVDVTHLTLNENLHVSDLKIPENIKLMTKTEHTLCTVSETREEETTDTTETTQESAENQTAAAPSASVKEEKKDKAK